MQYVNNKIYVDKKMYDLMDQDLDVPILFIPTHKSYIDFLLVSMINLLYGKNVPFIAAAYNLSKIFFVSWVF